jgi:hypothetical protein
VAAVAGPPSPVEVAGPVPATREDDAVGRDRAHPVAHETRPPAACPSGSSARPSGPLSVAAVAGPLSPAATAAEPVPATVVTTPARHRADAAAGQLADVQRGRAGGPRHGRGVLRGRSQEEGRV